ncbi:hypothetical protein [Shewanella sp. SR44-3]|uniref:hypothetical protein n=1 Tax=Shewanella sp. SR44-3 TaxID=2760936 RepID=UPI0015FD1BC5|nr:hypothetical protein [Shewanella sp. SR44-3]MBB1270249.1 hypothetical protein [Shewanella sp. SR44-3]
MKLFVYLFCISCNALFFSSLSFALNAQSYNNYSSRYTSDANPTHSARISVDGVTASVSEHLNKLNLLNYQYPQQAQAALSLIEQATKTDLLTKTEQLRFELLQCYNLLEQGEYQAAINSAQRGETKAKTFKLDHVRAYFILCQADALNYLGELDKALPLIDNALALAHQYQQPQAIVNALYLRATIDLRIENANSAMEDLRLALDIYPQAQTQTPSWQLAPKTYLLAAMGSLFFSTGDVSQAIFFTNKARADEAAIGKIEYLLLINAALITIHINEQQADDYINHAKKLLPNTNHSIELAYNYASLSVFDLLRNRLSSAEKQINISIATFSKYNHPLYLARAKRTLAQIRFKQGRDQEALAIMDQAIELAKGENHQLDLQEYYSILSQYYATKNAFKQAYEYQVLRFELEKKIAAKINQARFLQFKARANEQAQLTNAQATLARSQRYLTLEQTYALVALGLSLLFISILFFIKKDPKLPPLIKQVAQQEEEIGGLLKNAKRAGYPLSILLLNISGVRLVDLGDLQTHLEHTLREQDKFYRHSLEEIIVFLPHTSLQGARRVAAQVSLSIENWQANTNVPTGIASLQQLDSFEQLIKKAHLDQITKKNRQPSMTNRQQGSD